MIPKKGHLIYIRTHEMVTYSKYVKKPPKIYHLPRPQKAEKIKYKKIRTQKAYALRLTP
jgi:hypothetical protein